MPSNKKIFDKLVSRVKIYLVIIAVLLTIICISNINLVLPAMLLDMLIGAVKREKKNYLSI